MVIRSDEQRRAIFASMKNRFSCGSCNGGVFSKEIDEGVVSEKIGSRLQKEFAGRLPEYIAASVDWAGVVDPNLTYAQNKKKAERDFALFLDSKYSGSPNSGGCGSRFAIKDDDLWERVMATSEIRRVKATPEVRAEYVHMFNFPYSVQADSDLRIYPMHDAIAMWLDSADSMTEGEYAQARGAANKFLSDFGTRFSLKDDVKKLVGIGEFEREFNKDPTAEGVYNYLDDAELRDGDVGVKETTRILAGRLGANIDKNDPGFDTKRSVINRLVALSYDKPYVRDFKFGGEMV